MKMCGFRIALVELQVQSYRDESDAYLVVYVIADADTALAHILYVNICLHNTHD